ncbi:MAG: hypothetical protein H6Q82_851 [Deltaproteobacteria bacterium]|nr:hypothetical protein [Deltaproteobacteria bacterium]MBP2685758.1 hypothetical protein [Deltaproteobacteria bacterium]
MRKPVLATIALSLLALLFGWETRQALQATPGGQDNVATAPEGAWRPGVPTPDPQPPPDPAPMVAAITARPLFRQDRQPFRDQSGASGRNYEAELSGFALLGVLGFGDAPVGVVTGKEGNKNGRWEVKKGELLGGFKVLEVGMDGLRLTADGREFLLPLYAGPPTAAAGALRTEVPRRDAARPASSPGIAAPSRQVAPPASVATGQPAGIPSPARTPGVSPGPSGQVAPPASATTGQPAGIPSPARAPGMVSPGLSPPGAQPPNAPRYIPGRR